jgi:membrane fusion protein (multidrug efflux system)
LKSNSSAFRRLPLLGLLAAAALLVSCSGAGKEGATGKKDRSPAEVGYVVVNPASVPITAELSGRVTPYQMSEVRPQVAGILRKRLFKEGSIVRQGQTLYEIDPSLYRAAVNEAQANLASASANAEAARIRADRYRPLAEIEAVAKQDYTDAARQAEASVAQNAASLQTARINLRYTDVPAPITGRIGRSLVTEGSLVTANQTNPLAVIQRLDPIYVDIQQSSAELLALRRSLSQGRTAPGSAAVRLKLEDGTEYDQAGTVEFSEVMVDQNTGTVTLRARFPNAEGILLPGMFVRAIFAQSIDTHAFLVPQQAVSRDAKGQATLFIVGPADKALQRKVTADRTEGANWIVTEGLSPGDKVIVQAGSGLNADAAIRPVPVNEPQRIAPRGKGDSPAKGS